MCTAGIKQAIKEVLKNPKKTQTFIAQYRNEPYKMIEQLCECCHEWVNQMDLVWDLKEDRLVCIRCYRTKSKD